MPSSLLELWLAQAGKAVRPGRPDRLIDGFLLGYTEPTAQNTGLAAVDVTDAQLSNYAGSFTNVPAGATLSRLAISSPVAPSAADITLRESKIVGPASGTGALIDCSSPGCVRFRYEYCDVRPQSADNDNVLVVGHDYTGLRNNLSGGVDGHRPRNTNAGMGSQPNNVKILGEYIHDLFMKTPNAGHSDNLSHTDCIQVEGGTGTYVEGCALWGYLDPTRGQASVDGTWDNANSRATGDGNPYYPDLHSLSCFLISPNVGACDGYQLIRNWLYGATAKLNIAPGSYSANNGVLLGNRYARDGLDTRQYRTSPAGSNWVAQPYAWGSATVRDTCTRTENTMMDTLAAAN